LRFGLVATPVFAEPQVAFFGLIFLGGQAGSSTAAMARSPELARLFQQPDLPAQRHYEICRSYFHEAITADEIAQRFHLHVGSVPAIVRDFARDPDVNAFFAASRPGRKTSPKRDAIHQRACELRRQGATLADIHAALQREGFDVSESYLFRVLRRAGLAATRQGRPLRQPGDYANDGSLVDTDREISANFDRQASATKQRLLPWSLPILMRKTVFFFVSFH
jgi:transposase